MKSKHVAKKTVKPVKKGYQGELENAKERLGITQKAKARGSRDPIGLDLQEKVRKTEVEFWKTMIDATQKKTKDTKS